MKLTTFKKKLLKYPYFTSAIYGTLGTSSKTLHNQVDIWVKRGEVIKLRRGLYTLNSDDRKAGLSLKLAANTLYSQSYISLEFALSHYEMIPEAVYVVTSVTKRKTKEFTNPLGRFVYRNIKSAAFFGFETVKDEFGFDCLIATPEKALLDHLYLNIGSDEDVEGDFFEGSLRLQNAEQLNMKELEQMAAKMESKKLLKMVKALGDWRAK